MGANIPEELMSFISDQAGRDGYRIVNVSGKSGRSFYLEIVLDKKDAAITLDECTDFNRKVSFWIEEGNAGSQDYAVDVCSPGLDRELKSDSEFKWAEGKLVEVKLHEPVETGNVVVGKLLGREENGDIDIETEDTKTIAVESSNAAKVKLKPEL
ncbi:MAG: hypothetical protein HQ594_04350 [Candidatus Omnitrophica bacterium]|nr:hypothetical protein [Candidatus Omnitrophota bacterium]